MTSNNASQNSMSNGWMGVPGFRAPNLRSMLRVISGIVLAVAACTGLVIGGLVGVAALRGAKVMVVTSGSMEPSIHVGSVVLVKPLAGEAETGDVITFADATSTNGRTHLTTHRIIAKPLVNGVVHYQTQGDANAWPDANLAQQGSVIGEVIASVPYVGRLYHFVSTFEGRMIAVVIPVLLLVFRELAEMAQAARKIREQGEKD